MKLRLSCQLVGNEAQLAVAPYKLFQNGKINTISSNTKKKYHVIAPMGRFQLESIYLHFPPSSLLL